MTDPWGDPWAPLLVAAALGFGLRAAGLVLAGALRPDHPFVAWAGAVSQATLAAYVAGALLAPAAAPGLAGAGAAPVWARLAALAAALAVLALGRGRLGTAMAAGLLALAALRALG